MKATEIQQLEKRQHEIKEWLMTHPVGYLEYKQELRVELTKVEANIEELKKEAL